MNNIMKLAQEYAVRYRVNRAVDEARATLEAAVEQQAAEIERLKDDLIFVERWAVHHATKPHMTAKDALSCIQHYPAISAITKSYVDGKVPETRDPYAEIETEIELRHKAEQGLVDWRVKYTELQAKLSAMEKQEPVAFCVYFPTEHRQEYCQELDDLVDDLTNLEHEITPLFTAPKVAQPLPLMSEAFRTTASNGQSNDYSMVFKFNDLDSLHAADDEWRKFMGAQ